MPFRVGRTIARNASADQNDTINVKRALQALGSYEEPAWGLSPWPDEPMFQGIRAFQVDNGLRPDGVIKPNGSTERTLDESLRNRYEKNRSSRETAGLSVTKRDGRRRDRKETSLGTATRAQLSAPQAVTNGRFIPASSGYRPGADWPNPTAWALREAGRTAGGLLGLTNEGAAESQAKSESQMRGCKATKKEAVNKWTVEWQERPEPSIYAGRRTYRTNGPIRIERRTITMGLDGIDYTVSWYALKKNGQRDPCLSTSDNYRTYHTSGAIPFLENPMTIVEPPFKHKHEWEVEIDIRPGRPYHGNSAGVDLDVYLPKKVEVIRTDR